MCLFILLYVIIRQKSRHKVYKKLVTISSEGIKVEKIIITKIKMCHIVKRSHFHLYVAYFSKLINLIIIHSTNFHHISSSYIARTSTRKEISFKVSLEGFFHQDQFNQLTSRYFLWTFFLNILVL